MSGYVARVRHAESPGGDVGLEAVGDPLLGLAIGEVRGDRLDLHAVLAAELCGGLLEAIGVPRDQHEGAPPSGERSGERRPDACGAAGDQGPMHGGYDTLAPP